MSSITLDCKERESISLLIVEPSDASRDLLLAYAKRLELPQVSESTDHAVALRKCRELAYTHIIFSSDSSSMTA